MNNKNGGVSLLGILQIIFITLKLTGNIDWSWPWVLSPTLLPIGIVLTAGVIYALVLIIMIGLGLKTYEEVLKKQKMDGEQ